MDFMILFIMVDILDAISTIYYQGMANDQACRVTAKPKNGIGNLLRAAQATNRHLFHHSVYRVCLPPCDHLICHRRMN
jgi:hypothetical protein